MAHDTIHRPSTIENGNNGGVNVAKKRNRRNQSLSKATAALAAITAVGSGLVALWPSQSAPEDQDQPATETPFRNDTDIPGHDSANTPGAVCNILSQHTQLQYYIGKILDVKSIDSEACKTISSEGLAAKDAIDRARITAQDGRVLLAATGGDSKIAHDSIRAGIGMGLVEKISIPGSSEAYCADSNNTVTMFLGSMPVEITIDYPGSPKPGLIDCAHGLDENIRSFATGLVGAINNPE